MWNVEERDVEKGSRQRHPKDRSRDRNGKKWTTENEMKTQKKKKDKLRKQEEKQKRKDS